MTLVSRSSSSSPPDISNPSYLRKDEKPDFVASGILSKGNPFPAKGAILALLLDELV
jgi:hypothetical protein